MNMGVKFAAAGMVLAGAMLAGGCESTPDLAPSPGLGDPYTAPENDPQISVLSRDLQQVLAFHPAIVTEDAAGHMFVEVPIRNVHSNRYFVDYRFLFYDMYGVQLEPTMGWTFQALEPKQVARLRANSMSPEAETYRLEVKWAR